MPIDAKTTIVTCDKCEEEIYVPNHMEPNHCMGKHFALCCKAHEVGPKPSTAEWICMRCSQDDELREEYKGYFCKNMTVLMDRKEPLDMICPACKKWIADYIRKVQEDIKNGDVATKKNSNSQGSSEAAASHIGEEDATCEEAAKREEAAKDMQKLKDDMDKMKVRVARGYVRKVPLTWGSLDVYLSEDSQPPTNTSCSGLPKPPGLGESLDTDSDQSYKLVNHERAVQFPNGQGR